MGRQASHVELYASAVKKSGATYGMRLHCGKTQALCVGDAECLKKPDGSLFEQTSSLQYFGAVLSRDGRVDSEISRKLGAARADFMQLRQLWGHSCVTLRDKSQLFPRLHFI